MQSEKMIKFYIDFGDGFRSGCGQSPTRRPSVTNIHVPHFGPEFVAPLGAHRYCDVLSERSQVLFCIQSDNWREGLVTSVKVTDMNGMIDRDASVNRTESAQACAAQVQGLFLPYQLLRCAELRSEPLWRQMAWVRLCAYLMDMGLPLQGCSFPEGDSYWQQICGLSWEQMRERNELWKLDKKNRLWMKLDVMEVEV